MYNKYIVEWYRDSGGGGSAAVITISGQKNGGIKKTSQRELHFFYNRMAVEVAESCTRWPELRLRSQTERRRKMDTYKYWEPSQVCVHDISFYRHRHNSRFVSMFTRRTRRGINLWGKNVKENKIQNLAIRKTLCESARARYIYSNGQSENNEGKKKMKTKRWNHRRASEKGCRCAYVRTDLLLFSVGRHDQPARDEIYDLSYRRNSMKILAAATALHSLQYGLLKVVSRCPSQCICCASQQLRANQTKLNRTITRKCIGRRKSLNWKRRNSMRFINVSPANTNTHTHRHSIHQSITLNINNNRYISIKVIRNVI